LQPSQSPAQKSLIQRPALSPKQRLLARHSLFDEMDGSLWIDARKIEPELGAVQVMAWDNMMLGRDPIPDYPQHWRIFEWPSHPALHQWRKAIPNWVQQSCALFPSYQLKMLHFVGKYPQLLELLEHAPVLVWRLMQGELSETEIRQLLGKRQTQWAGKLGWPEQKETLKLLRKLRLRFVNQEVAESIETCLLDQNRLHKLQQLPRINSMALSLAARFPELIGSPLHQTLAQLPCRPMQCQSMIALLEDAFQLADFMQQQAATKTIGQCRYLNEVEALYQSWITQTIQSQQPSVAPLTRSKTPQPVSVPAQVLQLSQQQQHAWFAEIQPQDALYAWQMVDTDNETSLIAVHLIQQAEHWQLKKVRVNQNQLPTPQQLSQILLWLESLNQPVK